MSKKQTQKGKEPQEAQKAQETTVFLCLLCFLWFLPLCRAVGLNLVGQQIDSVSGLRKQPQNTRSLLRTGAVENNELGREAAAIVEIGNEEFESPWYRLIERRQRSHQKISALVITVPEP